MPTQAEITAKLNDPGPNGVLARLCRDWDPNGIGKWMEGERIRGTGPLVMARCLAEVCAGGAFGFALKTSDVRIVLTGPPGKPGIGIVGMFETSIHKKLDRHLAHKTPGGVFLPPDGFTVEGG